MVQRVLAGNSSQTNRKLVNLADIMWVKDWKRNDSAPL